MILFLFLYEIILVVCLLVYVPAQAFRRKIDLKALKEKFTFYHQNIKETLRNTNGSIWIQAVSVGEVSLIKSLVTKLRELTDREIIITTTTLTGNKVARKNYPQFPVLYFPFDFSFLAMRAVKLFKPELFISIETEIWPNLYRNLKKNNVPVIILNGRISAKAFNRYKKVKFFTKKIFEMVNFVGVQDGFYGKRFLSLGLEAAKISVTGNLKFAGFDVDKNSLRQFKSKYAGLKTEKEFLIIAASTHYPEEKNLLEIFGYLLKKFSHLKIMFAPRHIERISSLERLLISKRFNPRKISTLSFDAHSPKDVFLLDTVGDLFYFYSLADICFVGGSLVKFGGHNILEPLYFLKPTIFGPHMENFQDIKHKVLKEQAAVSVKDKEELRIVLEKLISDENRRKDLASKALNVFEKEKANLKNNLRIISRYIPLRGFE
ncbi:MAG: hypothetical protein KAS99_02280 [Candidatus Omnitrophica bacterium]|nr:hypothetical protein [Candidatus Omnitrophota bacterium]